jgi:hypothetical protein
MRYARNFHPEWGYLVPAPGLIRTARVALVATAIGATVGAGVVFSLVDYPATEISVSTRTLVGPVEAASARASPAQRTNGQFPTQRQSPPSVAVASQLADAAIRTATEDAPAKIAAAAPTAASSAPVTDPAPIKMKSTKKPNATSHYASRGEPPRLLPGENYLRKSVNGYYASGAPTGYHRDSGFWGGWSYWDSGWPYQFSGGRAPASPQGSPAAFLSSLGGFVTRVLDQSSP